MGLFDFLGIGKERKEKIADFKSRNAIMIDVRYKGEFQIANAPGSINIPLEEFQSQIKSIQKKNRPVLLCCNSGGRSGMANRFLSKEGVESYNAGSWKNLLE